jgi:hypothetical protein
MKIQHWLGLLIFFTLLSPLAKEPNALLICILGISISFYKVLSIREKI